MKRLCLTVIICAIFVFVRANVFESNGVMYDIIDSETLSVQVVPYLDENGESLYGYIVYIPATVKHNNDVYHVVRIGDHAFKGAENLYAIVMENGIECIGNEAFSGCTALRGITLTQSVREIGEKAFFGSALENITFRSASCPSLLGQDVFTSPENLRICFPASSMDNYRSVLGSIIEDKKQISFVNAESDGFLFNDMVFCSPGDASPTDKGEITMDWQSIAQGSRFDINMVIYVPAEDKIAILRPMLYGMGIGFRACLKTNVNEK